MWGTGSGKGSQLTRGRARPGDPAAARRGGERGSGWLLGAWRRRERGGRKDGEAGGRAAAKGGESEGEGRDSW